MNHAEPCAATDFFNSLLGVVEDAERRSWLTRQAEQGARIVSICDGAKVLAAAGLLEGREAAVHWYSRARLARKHPRVTWRQDRRWVTDGPITTTAGISASIPASLALLKEVAGEPVMRRTAEALGLLLPDQRHAGSDFRLTVRGAAIVLRNRLAFWRREDVALPMSAGLDELGFATALDAWSRTYRSTAWAAGPPAMRGLPTRVGVHPRRDASQEIPPRRAHSHAECDAQRVRTDPGRLTARRQHGSSPSSSNIPMAPSPRERDATRRATNAPPASWGYRSTRLPSC